MREIIQYYSFGDISMVGVAKGEGRDGGKEWFYFGGTRPFALRYNVSVLEFVERISDKAHCFMICSYRANHSKAIGGSPLDDIMGVGAARKRTLLAHFGSAKAISRANLADLEAVPGASKGIAKKLNNSFQPS